LKLYIDGLFYKGSGIGRYYESLTKEFAKRNIKIYTTVPKKFQNEFEKDFHNLQNIEPLFVDYDKFSFKGFIKQSELLKYLERYVDIFLYPHINLPLYIPGKTVCTVHDLRPFTKWWDRSGIKRYVFKLFFNRAVLKSKAIVCISQTVKDELLNHNPDIKEKIKVIHNFIEDKFVESQKLMPVVDKPYILFVGNRKKHKNLTTLIKAFALIIDKIPHYLVVAGSKDSNVDEIDILKRKLSVSDRVIEFISPPDDIIISLYQYSDLFVFPSLFEGFGLPPLESVSLGCPVVLSDIPILNEVFGDTGYYFNPYSENDLANKILSVLTDKTKRDNLLKKQKERLKIFDKNNIIDEYINLFKMIVEERL